MKINILRCFLFRGVTCGLCVLTVSHAATKAGQLKKLTIDDLLEIQVTSVSRSPSQLSAAPSALQVITGDQIRRSGVTSLPEALRLANNLNVAQKNANAWGISARGFNTELANKLLVMVDGRTVYTPLFSGVRWDAQDYLLEDIDRIEVISGPGGALWGANAVNGVINITSKDARATQGVYFETGLGSELQSAVSLRYGGQLSPNVYFRVYTKYTERDAEAISSGAASGDDSSITQGGFRLDAVTDSKATLTVQGDYYLGHEGFAAAGDGKIAGGNLLGRWTQKLANGSEAKLQLYYDETFLRQPFSQSLFGPAGPFSEYLDTYDLDFQHSIEITERNRVVWGLGYRFTHDDIKAAPVLGFLPPQLDHDLFSGFVQDQITLADKTILTVGTKLEHNDYTGFEIEPNIRIQRDLSHDRMVWGAVSRAVRTPSRIDRDIRQPSRGFTILAGGDKFRSETVVAYEVGLRAQFATHVAGTIALFYNQYDNIRSLARTPSTIFPLYFGNDLQGATHGVELTATTEIAPWWRLETAYTLLRTDIHVAPGGYDENNALNENADPKNQVSIVSSMNLPRGIEFDAHFRWVDSLTINNSNKPATVPSYAELNLRIGIPIGKTTELSFVGQNLLHDQHPEFGVPGPNRVEIQRSVFAKLVFRY